MLSFADTAPACNINDFANSGPDISDSGIPRDDANFFNTELSRTVFFPSFSGPSFVKLTELANLKKGVLDVYDCKSADGMFEYFPSDFCLTFTCSFTQDANGLPVKLITLSI